MIEFLRQQIDDFRKIINWQASRIKELESELSTYKNKKDSSNSSIPPSKDENRLSKNKSLRKNSGRNPGGQPGHKGKTLEFAGEPDEIREHSPSYCNCCGRDLSEVEEQLITSRQVIDIPVIKPHCIEHRIYRKRCSCGHSTESSFPSGVHSKIQYGPNIESLCGYLHARQYLPYNRMKELLEDVMSLPISVGGINGLLNRLCKKSGPVYERIKEGIILSDVAGSDETGVRVNGQKDWIWTWQNDELTFITHSDNRGYRAIEEHFENGLPDTVMIHDRYAAQIKCAAKHHQLCTAHLTRDLKYLIQLYPDSDWAARLKALFSQAIELKRELTTEDYYGQCVQREQLSKELAVLLQADIDKQFKQCRTLQKSLRKHQQYILYFLYHPKVPPDNNGSERAIRNIKVKQKISGQFKTVQGADTFAVLRSIIDTAIKRRHNVLNTLSLIANLGAE